MNIFWQFGWQPVAVLNEPVTQGFPSFVSQELLPSARNSRWYAQRFRCAFAIRSRPSTVFGPVDSPPCIRYRRFPTTLRALQGTPERVRAPQKGLWVLDLPVSAMMIAEVPRPSSLRRTIRARQTCFCGFLVDRIRPMEALGGQAILPNDCRKSRAIRIIQAGLICFILTTSGLDPALVHEPCRCPRKAGGLGGVDTTAIGYNVQFAMQYHDRVANPPSSSESETPDAAGPDLGGAEKSG